MRPSNLAAQFREFGRILQELHNFFKFLARFVDTRNIVEGHAALLFCEHLGARLAEAHRARAVVLLHLAEDEESDAENQQEGQRLDEHIHPEIRNFLRLSVVLDAIVVEHLEQVGIAHDIGRKAVAVRQRARHLVFGQDDVLDAAFLNLLPELGIGKRVARRLRSTAEHRGDEEHGKQDAAPDHHALHPGIALRFLVVLHSDLFPQRRGTALLSVTR